MIECIFTLDYEIYGNGQGTLRDLVLDPTRRLAELFQEVPGESAVAEEPKPTAESLFGPDPGTAPEEAPAEAPPEPAAVVEDAAPPAEPETAPGEPGA